MIDQFVDSFYALKQVLVLCKRTFA